MDEIKNMLLAIELYNNTPQENICLNIRKLFKQYKVEQVIDLTGMARQTVYSWTKIRGNKPTFESLLKICQGFNINLNDLLKEPEDEINNSYPNNKPCSYYDCSNIAKAGKYCWKHYQQLRRSRLSKE